MRQVETDTSLVEFSGHLEKFMRDLGFILYGYYRLLPPAQDLWWDTQDAVDEMEKVLGRLKNLAPDGYYFGPLTEQPTCWGFWKNDGYYGEKNELEQS
jgi:hypothetical protein